MPGSRSKTKAAGEVHVLNFFYDDSDDCSLTFLRNDYRFHVIAEHAKIDVEGNSPVGKEYARLIRATESEVKENDGAKTATKDNYKPSSISQKRTPEQSVPEGTSRNDSQDNDSGIDVAFDTEKDSPHAAQKPESAQGNGNNSEETLHKWMLQPFSEIFGDLSSAADTSEHQTLEEWYTGPTYFYNLYSKDGDLLCEQIDSSPELEERITNLMPKISIPKYIRNLDIPHYSASEITVLAESDDPAPFHPCRVRAGDATHFFKPADNTQPQPMRRELKILKEIERKGLHEMIRVPIVTGLVGYRGSKTQIMGFLQTAIEDPTPLTLMLDSDVVEEKRERWARETERMVHVLHENDIVWGDAKADNFVVDRHGELWIIDFGGSYTDGWVDPELMETEEGDDMGVEKIVNALNDPEANTYDPHTEGGGGDHGKSDAKRVHDSDDSEDDDGVSKRRKCG